MIDANMIDKYKLKPYVIDVRFEVNAPDSNHAENWISQELEVKHFDSDIINNWKIKAVIEECTLDEDDED